MKPLIFTMAFLGPLLAIDQNQSTFAIQGKEEVKGGEVSKKEWERHQGTWQAISYRIDGTETPKAIVESITRTVKGNHVVWKREGKSFAGTQMEIDPGKSPPTIDVIPDGGPFKGEKVLGIYQLENDRLTLCMAQRGKPRPENFEAPKGSGISLMKFKKVPSDEKKP